MSGENPTQKLPNESSFEERLFARLDAIEVRLDRMETSFAAEMSEVKARLSIVESRLDSLEEKVDARLRETRPIWEGVLMRLEGIENKQEAFNRQFREVAHDLLEMRSRIGRVEDIVLPPLS